MRTGQTTNWGLRIGLAFSMLVGAAWGVLLGWLLIRVNMERSPWIVVGAAMPAAFAGSMVVGLIFNHLLKGWHKAARLLAALLAVAFGTPFGLLWGFLEYRIDLYGLFSDTGALMWDFEWLMAILGLVGGMVPRWTIPFFHLWGRLVLLVLAAPLRLFEGFGRALLRLVASLADLVPFVGRAIVWLPAQFYLLVSGLAQNLGQTWQGLWTPRPAPSRRGHASRRDAARPHRRRAGPRLARQTWGVARNNGNNNGAARVVGFVEDRCPYCFDIVKRNDPRGVRVCEVCGTPHHADCWSITGKCQVPHLNT